VAEQRTHARGRRPRVIRQRPPRYDVVFYTPWVGSILSSRECLPPGGAETQELGIAKALAGCGVRVAIVAYGAPEDLPREVGGVAIVPRPVYRKRGTVSGKLVETWAIWRALWAAPSAVVVKRGAGVELGLVAAYTRATRRRLIFSSANVVDFDYATLLPKRRDLRVYEFGARVAEAIVVQTEEQVALCQLTFSRSPTLIKSIAAPAEPQRDVPEAFLWVGRVVSYKRPLEYLALARALPDAQFWMLGVPTPHGEAGERLVGAVHAEAAQLPNVELLAPRSNAEVGQLMSRAVASVNTAEFEGMPNVLLEGWSRGVPALVLSHDPGGAVATHGLGGFAGGSADRLAELGRELWETRSDRAALAARCRAYVAKHHQVDVVAAQWLEVLGLVRADTSVQAPGRQPEPICAE
jgi:glycosyltransferase involved in cell wall biosynthesis